MSSNTKTVLKGFNYRQCDDFAAYLNDMASRGWHFKEWDVGLVFERREPEKTEYAVEVFIGGTEYDTRPEPRTKEFAEYCEAAGWKLVDAKRKFCIFKKISPVAVPILTPEERLENTAKAMRGRIWEKVALSALWTFTQWFDLLGTGFINRIFSDALFMITGVWTMLFVLSVCSCIQFYLWKYKAAKKIRNGETIYFGRRNKRFACASDGYTWLSSGLILFLFASFILSGRTDLVITCIVIFGATILLGYLIAKFRPGSDTNQLIQTGFAVVLVLGFVLAGFIMIARDDEHNVSADHVPVTCEDLGIDVGELEDVTVDGSGSVFGYVSRYWLEYEDASVSYQVYETKHQWILNRIWKDSLDTRYNEDKTVCTEDWNADIAYRNKLGTYYVRYEDAVIIFSGSEDIYLTPEQAELIYASLYVR